MYLSMECHISRTKYIIKINKGQININKGISSLIHKQLARNTTNRPFVEHIVDSTMSNKPIKLFILSLVSRKYLPRCLINILNFNKGNQMLEPILYRIPQTQR